jgi:hypothetical protein
MYKLLLIVVYIFSELKPATKFNIIKAFDIDFQFINSKRWVSSQVIFIDKKEVFKKSEFF